MLTAYDTVWLEAARCRVVKENESVIVGYILFLVWNGFVINWHRNCAVSCFILASVNARLQGFW
jgi:hypothetical protein